MIISLTCFIDQSDAQLRLTLRNLIIISIIYHSIQLQVNSLSITFWIGHSQFTCALTKPLVDYQVDFIVDYLISSTVYFKVEFIVNPTTSITALLSTTKADLEVDSAVDFIVDYLISSTVYFKVEFIVNPTTSITALLSTTEACSRLGSRLGRQSCSWLPNQFHCWLQSWLYSQPKQLQWRHRSQLQSYSQSWLSNHLNCRLQSQLPSRV